jgi:hypothetical protein
LNQLKLPTLFNRLLTCIRSSDLDFRAQDSSGNKKKTSIAMQASRARVRLPPGEETGTEPGRIPAPRRCRGRRGRAVTRSGRACERRRMREGETLVERKKEELKCGGGRTCWMDGARGAVSDRSLDSMMERRGPVWAFQGTLTAHYGRPVRVIAAHHR